MKEEKETMSFTHEQLARAEENIRRVADSIAYSATEGMSNHKAQTMLFKTIRNYINYGARLMQEELMNINP